MPILSIKASAGSTVATVACAACLAETDVKVDGLTLGASYNPSVIHLPPCRCGAQEVLQRTADVHPDESLADHRKKVNAVAEYLRGKGRVHPAHVDVIKAMTKPAQIGELLGDVSESSLPEQIMAPKRQARSLDEAAASAAAMMASAPAPTSPTDPMATVLSLFDMAQKAFKAVRGRSPSGKAEPSAPSDPSVTEPTS